ncbi:hypothetical protein SAY87_016904 [Trapa incisa]|uniref:Uncharacterized protein n=1 Tax=Trapa incisa TaxID=236973 RepID=A0AAN7QZH9_9MYRT|nr:hypothetical protein SAY87_016904 [Trapa incisa]
MAANCARRALELSSATARAFMSRPSSTFFSSGASKLRGVSATKPGSSSSRLFSPQFTLGRLPVELGGVLTVMPLHSVTASALFTSLLSLSDCRWGCLSEGSPGNSDHHYHGVDCREIAFSSEMYALLFNFLLRCIIHISPSVFQAYSSEVVLYIGTE